MTLVALAAIGLLACSGCAQESASGASTGPCAPKLLEQNADLPADFPVSRKLELTHFKERRGFLSARGIETRSVEELYRELRVTVPKLGYDIIGNDYEGFEAEIFFARERKSQGVVSMREGPCRGLVTVSVLYDPVDTNEGRDVLHKTRKRLDRYGSS
ncbi:MAG: hypothetical protein ACRDJB_07660 [Actinomycetota bacterium]